MSDQSQDPSSPPEGSLTELKDSSSEMVTPFVIPDEHLKVGQIRVGDRVELLTKKTHYVLDRLGDTNWSLHAAETPLNTYQVLVIGCQPIDNDKTIPDVLAEGLCMVVRAAHNNARMVTKEVKKIVWKRGYH